MQVILLLAVLALFLILQMPKKSGFDSPDMGISSTSVELGNGNSAILKDLEGAVNQRNYPMVGKDQGALDYTATSSTVVEGLNTSLVNVNSLPYPIEGYNLLPEFVGESDIEAPMLDVTVPSTVVPMMPYGSPASTMPYGSPEMLYESPEMLYESPALPADIAGPYRPVIGTSGNAVSPIS